jgi:hypothetical protein
MPHKLRSGRRHVAVRSIPHPSYIETLRLGGVSCWWCSETCIGPCMPMPTRPAPPWGLVVFFCCVGCAKAYMVDRGLRVYYLKLYARLHAGIPFSCPLPCSPPWQTLKKYGPPAGVLTYDEFRSEKWNGAMRWGAESLSSVPTRMGRYDLEEIETNAATDTARRTRKRKESARALISRMGLTTTTNTRRVGAVHTETPLMSMASNERLTRKGPKASGGILSFFTTAVATS